jgi:hypothetical protein
VNARVAVGLASVLLGLVLTVSPTMAGSKASSPSSLTLVAASELRPSQGGPAAAPLGFRPLHAREFALAKAAANTRAGVGVKAPQAPGGGGGGGPTVSSYTNVSPSFSGAYQTQLTPPDTTGAIGPDRYIETINTKYAIFNRTGSQTNSGSLSSLTGISTGLFGYSLSDPQMMWDAKTQRFYYVAVYYDSLFLSDNGIAIGWSTTATPASSNDFCKYAVSFGADLPDYPKLGDSSDFLLVGYNQFGNFASTYDGSAFVTVNKPPAGLACAPVSAFAVHESGVLRNADASLAATPVPANLVDDGNGTGYVVANADLSDLAAHPSGAGFVSLYTVATSGVDASGIPVPSITGPTNVAVPAYSMPANAPEKGSSFLLDTLDGRFEAAVAAVDPGHSGSVAVWTAHAVFGGAGVEERWYELDAGGGGSLLQSGVATSSSLFIWNGAISPDRNGTTGGFGGSMAISVSTSSATDYPAIQFVTKAGAGPQSALTNLVQSNGPNVDFSCDTTTPCRWGDYSGASPDPAPSATAGKVWLANQYNVASGTTSDTDWRTWVFGVTPGSSSPSPTAPDAPTLNSATGGDGQVTLQWSAPSSNGGSTITSYKIYRGITSGGENLTTPVATVSGSTFSYTDGGLTNGAPYFYKVSAVNSVGEGPLSNEMSATPQASSATVPTAPLNLTAAPANGRGIQLSWAAPASDGGSPITGYKVFRGTASGGETLLTTVSGPSFKDTRTSRGATYYYYVKAVNAVGDSLPSDERFAQAI